MPETREPSESKRGKGARSALGEGLPAEQRLVWSLLWVFPWQGTPRFRTVSAERRGTYSRAPRCVAESKDRETWGWPQGGGFWAPEALTMEGVLAF